MARKRLRSLEWAWLPTEILTSFLQKMRDVTDQLRFAAVCKPWQSAAIDYFAHQPSPSQLPFLLIPSAGTGDDSSVRHERRGLYNVAEDKIMPFEVQVLGKAKRACGSSHGWLATADTETVITLFNPFTGKTISLPPLEKNPPEFEEEHDSQIYVKKVILSADPSSGDYEVAAICSDFSTLAVFKPEYRGWIFIDKEIQRVTDVIYHESHLYAVRYFYCGVFDIGNVHNLDFPKIKVIPFHGESHVTWQAYLVESTTKDLLLVHRYMDYFSNVTSMFVVYKRVQNCKGVTDWVRLHSIGDDALFLGNNHSMAVQASKFPGCRPDSIYFTDDIIFLGFLLSSNPRNMGIFNLKDTKNCRRHYVPNPAHKNMPSPIWILPPSGKSLYSSRFSSHNLE